MNKQNCAKLSVFSNTVLVLFKIIIGLSMGSVSVISEGIHSGIDLLASIIAYFSIKEASKEKDDDHNYGHGKYENVSGFVEALLILLAGVLIIYEAIKKITLGSEIQNLGIGIGIMMFASVINFVISMYLLRVAKKENSLALEADGMHLLTDVFTSLGVVIGLIIVKFTGVYIFDPIAAIIVALLILNSAKELIQKSLVDLVDTSIDIKDIEKIKLIILNYKEVRDYHKLRTRKIGSSYEMDIHIKMDKNMTLDEVHEICNFIEQDIAREYPLSYVVIHAEPYRIRTS